MKVLEMRAKKTKRGSYTKEGGRTMQQREERGRNTHERREGKGGQGRRLQDTCYGLSTQGHDRNESHKRQEGEKNGKIMKHYWYNDIMEPGRC